MIESARKNVKESNLQDKIHFDVCDVRDEPVFQRKFDLIHNPISSRHIIAN
jgi:tRNA A58 N-methylase Trm61